MTESSFTISILEIMAVILQTIFILLAWKERRSAWVFGGLGSALSIGLFWFAWDLRAEAILYVYYVYAAIVGYVKWGKIVENTPIITMRFMQHIWSIFSGLLLSSLLYFLIYRGRENGLHWEDSLSTGFAFVATYLSTKKILSHWVYWMIINPFAAWLYLRSGAQYYAFTMLLFTALAVIGYIRWKKEYQITLTETE